MGVLMQINGLTRSFALESGEQTVLKDISLTVNEGDFAVIMGASGSGKSTLLYAMSGMDKPSSGEILFQGKNIAGYSSDKLARFRRKHCGFVFQQICLVDSLSVMDNVMTAGLLSNRNRHEVYVTAKALLHAVEVEEHTWTKLPSQISGGRAQRVGIVRALVNHPDILFADEPTGALNSQTGLEVLDTVTKFNRGGQTVVMVTHDMRSALRGNRVLYLKDGRILNECELGRYEGDDPDRREKLLSFLCEMGW